MQKHIRTTILVLFVLMFFSCDFKNTRLINTIHEDGSISRKVMVTTNTRRYLELYEIDVPVDSTWKIDVQMKLQEKDTCKADTIWYLTAEKLFKNADEINEAYAKDNGHKNNLKKRARFSKNFRWFYNEYRYSETVYRINDVFCPIADFLTHEELDFIYLPDEIRDSLKNSMDSLKYKILDEAVEAKSEIWLATAGFRQWVEVFYSKNGNDSRLNITKDKMLTKELHFLQAIKSENNTDNEDSVYVELFGKEFYDLFKQEVDSALSTMIEQNSVIWNSGEFDMEIQMPGKVIATNGYIETGDKKGILWSVNPEYFLTQDYEMWVVSRVNNYALWILTALLLLAIILVRNKISSK